MTASEPDAEDGYRAILFDLDGTLIDSVPDLAWSLERTMRHFSLSPCGEQRVRAWIGNGVDLLLARALAFCTGCMPAPDQLAAAVSVFRDFYAEHFWVDSRLYPGVKETLANLADAGVRLACITNKPAQFAAPLLQASGVLSFFSVVLGTGPDMPNKPDPQMVYRALEVLRVPAARAVLVGDSATDFATANNAGLPAWLVSYGYHQNTDLNTLGADRVIEQFADLDQGRRKAGALIRG